MARTPPTSDSVETAAGRSSGHVTPGTEPPARSTSLALYRLITTLARPAAGLILRQRAKRGKEDPARRGERLGYASLPRPAGPMAWVHAASVGEANAVLPLMSELLARRPDLELLLTTGTVTSARLLADRLPPRTRHQFVPLDAVAIVRRFLAHWRPDVAVFTEQEVWPNLVVETSARQVPLVLVNARMSDQSFERWQARADMGRVLFSRFSLVLAQNELLARRFAELGAPVSVAAGNLKIDAPPPPVDAEAANALAAALAGRPRFLAASTHEGEETIVAAAHRLLARRIEGLVTILAPRHPERGPSISEALRLNGFRVARRSLGELPDSRTDIYVADTLGELGTLYAMAPVSFVGGSLVARGGQNPIEAVRHGSVVLTGPNWTNFPDFYGALLAASGAVEVRSAEAMADAVVALLTEPARLQAAHAGAEQALGQLAGALTRTAAAILDLLPAAATPELARAGH